MGFYDTEASITTRPHEQKTAYPRSSFVGSGYRAYSPVLGRWISRDPIQESVVVSKNIEGESSRLQRAELKPRYVFVGNNSGNTSDLLGLIYGVTVQRARAMGLVLGVQVNLGHQWIAYDGTSVGFWPNRGWALIRPDPATKKPFNRAYMVNVWWDTKQKKTGKMKWGKGKDIRCNCVIKWHVIDCLNSVPNPGWKKYPSRNNCRKFSWWALKGCCLKKGKKTDYGIATYLPSYIDAENARREAAN